MRVIACARSGAHDDQLGEQRVVEQRDLVADLDAAVPANARARRAPAGTRCARSTGRKPLRGILAGDPALDAPSRAGVSQPGCTPHGTSPAGDAELLPDQVDAVHQLGDRMLDLDPGVHLEEVEPPSSASRNSHVPAPRYPTASAAATAAAPIRSRSSAVTATRRGLFDQLLMAPLDRALPLAQVHGALVDPPEPGSRCGGAARCTSRGRRSLAEGLRASDAAASSALQLRRARGPPACPFPPPPAAALTSTGIADLLAAARRAAGRRPARVAPGHDRHPGRLHAAASLGLVTHGPNRGRRRADEDQPRLAPPPRRTRPARPGSRNRDGPHRRPIPAAAISARCESSSRTDAAGPIGMAVRRAHVGAQPVGCGIDRDRLEAFSWQARMIRSAISPRFATSTRFIGREASIGQGDGSKGETSRSNGLVRPDFPSLRHGLRRRRVSEDRRKLLHRSPL